MIRIGLLCLVVASYMGSSVGNAVAADRPNFVWLISEDNSKHFLKLFDDSGAETPHIRKLAEHGLLFPHAFSNAPVCSVARTTLITSCYGPRIGTQFHRRSKMVPMPESLRMFPAYLRDAGYYTTNKSKTDYNAIPGKDVWDTSSKKASWRNRAAGQPFFHKQSFGTSHEGSLHFSASVMAKEKPKTDPNNVAIAPYHPNTKTFRYTYARYHDRIQAVDAEIGAVVRDLEADGLLEDTFIFYFGDHGGVLPRGKGYAYESGLHVPLVIRVPKNFQKLSPWPVGSEPKAFVSFVDFGPTLLHLAGLPTPKKIDGRPFLGKDLDAGQLDQRDEAFGYADRFDEKYDLVRTLRKGRYTYIRNYQPFNFDGLQNNYRYRMLAYAEWRELFHAGKLNDVQSQFFRTRPAEQLFDVEQDPHETKNLATDAQFADVLKQLRGRLRERLTSMPDLSFFPESHLYEAAFDNPVEFGQQHADEIERMLAIADLSLVPYSQAEAGLRKALASQSPWERYWGLIACSCHGNAAKGLTNDAKKLAASDGNHLVRARAAEFLSLIGVDDPRPVIMDVLAKCSSGVEACLILNTVVLLRDGPTNVPFSVSATDLHRDARKHGSVQRRMEYLTK